MDNPEQQPQVETSRGRPLLRRALKRARGSILWERLWPLLASLATAVGLFLAFSWAGLWVVLPPLARAAALLIFALVALASLVPSLWLGLALAVAAAAFALAAWGLTRAFRRRSGQAFKVR